MECVYIPSFSFAEFSLRFHHARAERLPLVGSIEVTPRCNLRCAHCYINLPAGDAQARARELSTSEWQRVLDQMAEAGCLMLLMTGGEPFIRPDFLDIYTYAKQKGLLVTVFTNGTMITPQIADYLSDWPPYAIEITIYGHKETTYEQVTGVPGSYARCMRGIELLLDRQLPLALKSTLTRANQHEVHAMKAFAEGLGTKFRFDAVLNMRLDGGQRPSDLRITPQEVVTLDVQDKERVEAWQEMFQRLRGVSTHPTDLYQCGAGVTTFHIDAYGSMSACMMARQHSYDLRTGSFQEGWQSLKQVRMQQRTKTTACQSCDLFRLCSQCPGVAFLEGGDEEKPVDYLCQITHLRAEALGLMTE